MTLKFNKKLAFCLLVLIFLLTSQSTLHAAEPRRNYENSITPAITEEAPDEQGTAEEEIAPPFDPNASSDTPGQKFLYEKPDRKKFSQLYWALGMLDADKDADVDNFLQINECDIYKDYFYNEFEWKNVRESARKFLKGSARTFPTRFEIVQPLLLGEYDTVKQRFAIQDEYQINESSRLEVYPPDFETVVCQSDGLGRVPNIPGYPVGVIAELNRPVTLLDIPLSPEIARIYVEEKMKPFKNYSEQRQNLKNLYELRDAYIFFKFKFFSYKGTTTNRANYSMAQIMTTIEGFEIYADKDKKLLLWSQDYRKKKTKSLKKHLAPKNPSKDPAPVEAPAPAPVALPVETTPPVQPPTTTP